MNEILIYVMIQNVEDQDIDIEINPTTKCPTNTQQTQSKKKRCFQRKYFCDHCGRGFKYNGSMQNHQKNCVGSQNR